MPPFVLFSVALVLISTGVLFMPKRSPAWDGPTALTPNATRAAERKAAAHMTRSKKLAQAGSLYARSHIDWATFNRDQNAHRFARVVVYSRDLSAGPLIVREPVLLEFGENIVVDFNRRNDSRPTPEQLAPDGAYPYENGFALDFFAGIIVFGDSVTIDGRGNWMRMSPRFFANQGHYAHICVSELPFIRGEGPGNSGSSLRAATNLVLRDLDLRDSSHHAIHGHGAINVTMHNVDLRNYSVAALSVNGWTNVYGRKLIAHGSASLSRLNGRFTQARFGVKFLAECEKLMATLSKEVPVGQRAQFEEKSHACGVSLRALDEAMHEALESNGAQAVPEIRSLFFSVTDGILDGGAARGFVVTDKGAEVLMPGSEFIDGEGSDGVLFEDCEIHNTVSHATQAIGVRYPENSTVGGGYSAGTSRLGAIMNGPVGDVFDVDRLLRLGLNALSRAQLALSDAAHLYDTLGRSEPLERRKAFGHSNISPGVIAAARLATTSDSMQAARDAFAALYVAGEIVWQFDVDPQAHVPKGTIALGVSSSRAVTLVRFLIDGVEARGDAGLVRRMPGQSDEDVVAPGDWTYANGGHPLRGSFVGYRGADSTGLLLSGNSDVRMSGLRVRGVTSQSGIAREVVRL